MSSHEKKSMVPSFKSRLRWNEEMLVKVKNLNNFYARYSESLLGRDPDYVPVYVGDSRVGVVAKELTPHLTRFPDAFSVDNRSVTLAPRSENPEERTTLVESALTALRSESGPNFLPSLVGWRNERYVVSSNYGSPVLMKMERAATSIFGIKEYGVHINGVVKSSTPPDQAQESSPSGVYMWIGRRSKTKQTYPGLLDHIAAGGLTASVPVEELMMRECEEEASVPRSISGVAATPAGSVAYCCLNEYGVSPEREFVFDLELSADFRPVNTDGETECFYLWPIELVRDKLPSGEFKPNVAIVILDYLIRHGFVRPDLDPNYCAFMDGIHNSL